MDMIERVARALDCVDYGNCRGGGWFEFGKLSAATGKCAACLRAARNAIEEMREPTEEMIEEAWAAATAEDAEGVWRAMIDAALSQSKEKE